MHTVVPPEAKPVAVSFGESILEPGRPHNRLDCKDRRDASPMPDRRAFLKSLSNLPLIGGLFAPNLATAAPKSRDFFRELGVRPIINAAGTYTALSASLMPAEAQAAWNYAAQRYARLDEVHDAVGKRI